ncbi:hypothetical protein HK097_009843 [Rhizophlyctis rosea]|uniref:Uncharacterized protein n=1 Tax=Rhizophlyctis rosea TaxID=64517 RepID=A0AAD5SKN1_9FUNG|nr:hypothetical protein HK097_009843 [Rhizophlyctis rosea]
MADVATAPSTYQSHSQYDSTVSDFQTDGSNYDYGYDYDDEFDQENDGRAMDVDQSDNQYYPNDHTIGDEEDEDDDDDRSPSRASQVLARAAQALETQIAQTGRTESTDSFMDGLRRKFVSQPALSDPDLFVGEGSEWKGPENEDEQLSSQPSYYGEQQGDGTQSGVGRSKQVSASLSGILKSGSASQRTSVGGGIRYWPDASGGPQSEAPPTNLRSSGKRVSIADSVVTEVHPAAGGSDSPAGPPPPLPQSAPQSQRAARSVSFRSSKQSSKTGNLIDQPIKETSPLASSLTNISRIASRSGGGTKESTPIASKHASATNVHPISKGASRKTTATTTPKAQSVSASKSDLPSQKDSTAATPHQAASTTTSQHGSKPNLASTFRPTSARASQKGSMSKLRSPPPLSLPPSPRPSHPALPAGRPLSRKGSQFVSEGENELLGEYAPESALEQDGYAAGSDEEYGGDEGLEAAEQNQDKAEIQPEEPAEEEHPPSRTPSRQQSRASSAKPSRQPSRASSAKGSKASLGSRVQSRAEENVNDQSQDDEAQTASAAEEDSVNRPSSSGPRRIRKKYDPGVHISGIEFRRLPAVEKMAEKLFHDREREEEHLNRLLLLRLTNPWSSVPVRDAIERIGSGKGTFNTPQLPQSRPRPSNHPYRQIPAPKPKPLPNSQVVYYTHLAQPRPIPELSAFPPGFIPRHTLTSARSPDQSRLEVLSRPRKPKYVEPEIYSIHGPPKKIDQEVLDRLTRPRRVVVSRPGSARKPPKPKKAHKVEKHEEELGQDDQFEQEAEVQEGVQEELQHEQEVRDSVSEDGQRLSTGSGPPKASLLGRYSRLSSNEDVNSHSSELKTVREASSGEQLEQEEEPAAPAAEEEVPSGETEVRKVPPMIEEEDEEGAGDEVDEDTVIRAMQTALPPSIASSMANMTTSQAFDEALRRPLPGSIAASAADMTASHVFDEATRRPLPGSVASSVANLTASQVFDEAVRRPLPGSMADLALKREVSIVREKVVQEIPIEQEVSIEQPPPTATNTSRTASQIFDFAAAQPLPPSRAASLSRPGSAVGSRTNIAAQLPHTQSKPPSAPPSKPPSRAPSASQLRPKPGSKISSINNLTNNNSQSGSRTASKTNLTQNRTQPGSKTASTNNLTKNKSQPFSRTHLASRSLQGSRAGSATSIRRQDSITNPVVKTVDIHQTSVTTTSDASQEVQQTVDIHSEIHRDGTVKSIEQQVESVTEQAIVEVGRDDADVVGAGSAGDDAAAKAENAEEGEHAEVVEVYELPETQPSEEQEQGQPTEAAHWEDDSGVHQESTALAHTESEQEAAARKIQGAFHKHLDRREGKEGEAPTAPETATPAPATEPSDQTPDPTPAPSAVEKDSSLDGEQGDGKKAMEQAVPFSQGEGASEHTQEEEAAQKLHDGQREGV